MEAIITINGYFLLGMVFGGLIVYSYMKGRYASFGGDGQ